MALIKIQRTSGTRPRCSGDAEAALASSEDSIFYQEAIKNTEKVEATDLERSRGSRNLKSSRKKRLNAYNRTASACHLTTRAAIWRRLLVTENWKGAIGGESCHKSSASASTSGCADRRIKVLLDSQKLEQRPRN